MAGIPEGVYTIRRPRIGGPLLTILPGSEGPITSVVQLPQKDAAPAQQEGQWEAEQVEDQLWEVRRVDTRGSVTIKNLRNGGYMSFEGEPVNVPNLEIRTFPEPRLWLLMPAGGPNTFYIFAPGTDLLIDNSFLLILPARTALRPKREDSEQDWEFRKHE